MILLPPRSTRTDTLFPYTTLFRSPPCIPVIGDGPVATEFDAVDAHPGPVDVARYPPWILAGPRHLPFRHAERYGHATDEIAGTVVEGRKMSAETPGPTVDGQFPGLADFGHLAGVAHAKRLPQ